MQDAHVDNGRWTGSVGLQAAAGGQGVQNCRQWQVDRECRIAGSGRWIGRVRLQHAKLHMSHDLYIIPANVMFKKMLSYW